MVMVLAVCFCTVYACMSDLMERESGRGLVYNLRGEDLTVLFYNVIWSRDDDQNSIFALYNIWTAPDS